MAQTMVIECHCDKLIHVFHINIVLQCFDAVGWAAGRASGLQKLSGEVLTW